MLLLAAGRGTRFRGEVPKAFADLGGAPILVRSAERLCRVADPRRGEGELLVVAAKDDRAGPMRNCEKALSALGARFVDGGATRQQSMANGFSASDPSCEVVLVHDAARPFFPIEAARACIARALEQGAALLAIPCPDTPKLVAGGFVERTLDRGSTWLAQTPQAIRRDVLAEALRRAREGDFRGTDDVSLVEHAGGRVAVVEGSPSNLKITRPSDLALAEAILGREVDR
ncbi:MAG: 2-C-methyl-D-erythritol 4-phosphate cytidylyltransferase [Planctomycetota bacterium]